MMHDSKYQSDGGEYHAHNGRPSTTFVIHIRGQCMHSKPLPYAGKDSTARVLWICNILTVLPVQCGDHGIKTRIQCQYKWSL